jgi:hypothetical protein
VRNYRWGRQDTFPHTCYLSETTVTNFKTPSTYPNSMNHPGAPSFVDNHPFLDRVAPRSTPGTPSALNLCYTIWPLNHPIPTPCPPNHPLQVNALAGTPSTADGAELCFSLGGSCASLDTFCADGSCKYAMIDSNTNCCPVGLLA